MKVLVDMNVSRHVIDHLRRRGVDAVSVSALLDPRAPDEEIVALARDMGAVVLSHDQDFSAILARTRARQPSLINLRLSEVDAASIANVVHRILQDADDELRVGAIVTVGDNRIRIHGLPVGGG